MGIVGSVIYLSLPKNEEYSSRKKIITRAIIAGVAGVSVVAIRNVYKEIQKKLSLG